MIDYVQDTSHWEEWQRDYRLGLILIMPPPEVSGPIDILRQKYDPIAQSYCPTHISVSDPLRHELTPESAAEVRDILSRVEPFMLSYDNLHASTAYPGICYTITPQEPIDNLKQALHAASVFEGGVYRRRHFGAHMAIAEFISIEDGLRISAQLQDTAPSGSFLCDRLEFIVPDGDFHFHSFDTFFLGRR
jgi:hypothetical protein